MVLVTVMVLSMFSVTAMAWKTTFSNWTIEKNATRYTGAVLKTDTTSAVAGASKQSCAAGIAYVTYKGVAADYSQATRSLTYSVAMPGFTLTYNSGYGIVNDSYRLSIHNKNTSAGAVVVSGGFTP